MMTTEIPDVVTFVDRNTIAFERRLPFSTERVWTAITVKKEIDQWFMKTELDLQVGGRYSFERGWDGWIGDLKDHSYVQFNSTDEAFSLFEIEPDGDGTLFRLTDRLRKDFDVKTNLEVGSSEEQFEPEVAKVLNNQPGGPGTHWTGVVSGWHDFVDALERYLTSEPAGLGYEKLSLLYDQLLTERWNKSEVN